MYIDVSFTDYNNKLLQTEERTNLTLVIKQCIYYKMRYSIEPKERNLWQVTSFYLSLKNIGKYLCGKYSKNFWYSYSWATKVSTDALKTSSKRAIQNTLEAIGDLIGNKIADEITNTSSENVPETNSINRFNSTLQTAGVIPKEIYILPKKTTNTWWA